MDVGFVTPGGSDGVSPLSVLWGCFDKEEEEDVLASAFLWVVQLVAEVAEAPGLFTWDGEALVDESEAVDQVAIGVGFDVADNAVVQLLPTNHHHRQHQAGGHQLHTLAFSYPAEIHKHPGILLPGGGGPCLIGDGGEAAGVCKGGGEIVESLVPVLQRSTWWVFHPRLSTFNRRHRQL